MSVQLDQVTLAERIAAADAEFASGIPAETYAVFVGEQAQLAAAGRPAEISGVGAPMPDGELLDAQGEPTSLTRIRNGRPAVVVFYRGAWCPYCNVALRFYEEGLATALRDRGVSLIAISPQLPAGSLAMAESNQLSFSVLSDPGNQIAGRLGILTEPSPEARAAQRSLGLEVSDHNADATATLPMPSVALVDAEGVLRWIDVHSNYTSRTEPAAVLAAVDMFVSAPVAR
jgi:peroxiredoxin